MSYQYNNPSPYADSKPSRGKTAADIIASASRHTKPPVQRPNYAADPQKALWCNTQWANLSIQAKKLIKLPTLPYFDEETMLLSREVNHVLWDQLVSLYSRCSVVFWGHVFVLLAGLRWSYTGNCGTNHAGSMVANFIFAGGLLAEHISPIILSPVTLARVSLQHCLTPFSLI
jgi:hypothetical protein